MIDKFVEPKESVKLARLLIGLEERITALEEAVKALSVDPGVDWVGRVVRERLLADLHQRMLRESAAQPRARVKP